MSRQFHTSAKAESKPVVTSTQSQLLQNSRGDRDLSQASKPVAAPPILHEALNIPIHSTDRPIIQPKLTIEPVGDKYEQEADRIAAQVVNQINAPQSSQRSEATQRQENDEDDKLQMKPALQNPSSGIPVAPELEAEIGRSLGSGQSLVANVRTPMEKAFGVDFSRVRVHTDGRADALNRSVGARAFTTGQDLFFKRGEYQPGSRSGQELIAHELVHVAQQRGRTRKGSSYISQKLPQQYTTAKADFIQRKPDFVIPAHFTGEQYITKAALLLDPKATVTVFADPRAIEKQYREDAQKIGIEFFEIYNRRHHTKCKSDDEAKEDLNKAQELQLERTVSYFRAGLDNPAERVFISKSPGKTMTTGSTQTVREAYLRDPSTASEKIIKNIQASLDWETCKKIREYFTDKGFKLGEKYVLLWGRKSGEMLGAGAYLDTNEIMLAQMMMIIRKRDPDRKLVLIGDPIDLPAQVDGSQVPDIDIDLVQYWKKGLPGQGNINAQFYFLNWLKMATDTVAIGTNSGIIEIPHLLGMSTVYLENVHLHKRKGLRWQLLASKYEFEYSEGDIKGLLSKKKGAQKTVPKVDKELENASKDKVLVTSGIRPGLVRFSTTGATEFWVLRKQVLGEVDKWIRDSGVTTLEQVTASTEQIKIKAKQDEFLKLIVKASKISDDQRDSNKVRTSYAMMHNIKNYWGELISTKDTCLCPIELKEMARQAIATIMRRHAFTKEEEEKFWETFNYTYVNTDLSHAPDFKAGIRAWLRDSEEIWTQVKNKGQLGSRVQQIKKEMDAPEK